MTLPDLPVSWLFDQQVPLFYFIVALLTRPAQWGKLVKKKFSAFTGNDADS